MEEQRDQTWEELKAHYKGRIEKIIEEHGTIGIAFVDDDTLGARSISDYGDAEQLQSMLEGMGFTVTSDPKKEADFHISLFDNPTSFINLAEHYDMCVVDGNFDDQGMTGPQAVRDIRAANNSISILGRSAEERFNKQYEKLGCPTLPKDPRHAIPQNMDVVCEAIISGFPEEYPDPNTMDLKDLIETQTDDF